MGLQNPFFVENLKQCVVDSIYASGDWTGIALIFEFRFQYAPR